LNSRDNQALRMIVLDELQKVKQTFRECGEVTSHVDKEVHVGVGASCVTDT